MIARQERARVLAQLTALAARGVPRPDALAAIREELPARAAALLDRGLARAREGAPLARVLAEAGLVGPRDRALLEATGGEETTRTLALMAEEEAANARRDDLVRRLLARPLLKLVLLLLLGLILIWAGAATQQYARVVDWETIEPASNPDLVLTGPTARVVIGTICAFGGFLALVMGFRALGRSRHGRRFLEGVGSRLPVIGSLIQLETSATFFRTLGTGLGSGLDLPGALDRAAHALGGRLVAEQATAAAEIARDGASVTRSLGALGFADETAVWLVGAAAARADLPRELVALAASYERRLQREAERLLPILIFLPELVGIGAIVLLLPNGGIMAMSGSLGNFLRML